MRRFAGLLVATTHLGFAAHAMAESPGKGHQSAKRAAAAVAATHAKRIESLGGVSPPESRKTEPAAAKRAAESLFSYADHDQDGSVSFGEFATVANESLARRIAKRFEQLDRNHDGRCTRAEVNKMSAERFLRFDLDQSGDFTAAELAVVMKRELLAHLERAYTRLDLDHDGRFSVAELAPARVPAPLAAAEREHRETAKRQVRSVY